MNNLLDYLDWRGDISFDVAMFCDVDALILCRLSYIPFDSVVPEGFSESISVIDAAEKVLAIADKKRDERTYHDEHDPLLLEKIIQNTRYADIRLTGYVNVISEESQKQFSATTFLLPDDTLYIAFRGTDGTLVGWKEDFNMSFIDIVPSQSDAVAYVEKAANRLSGKIRVGGHSKGGNLAVYACAFCNKNVHDRLIQIRNFDGPGFNENTIASNDFKTILPIVRTYIPQSSIVGMLLEHSEDFTVVYSTGSGILQHDMYTWDVTRDGLMCIEQLSNSSQFIDATLKDWLSEMPMEKREKMIDGIYSIMLKADITDTQNIFSRHNIVKFFKNFEDTDEETKNNITEALKILRKSLKNSIVFTLNNAKKNPMPEATGTSEIKALAK